MEFQKPLKSVLSLGKFGFDVSSSIRTKITFSGSSDNGSQNSNQIHHGKSDLEKKNKFSSRLRFTQSTPNCIDILKSTNKKPIIGSHVNNDTPQMNNDTSLSHMPVYHKVSMVFVSNYDHLS